MGGLFSSKQKTTSQQSTQVPLNFSQLMDRTISFANEGLDTPFQAYNAPRIAELSANEQAGINAAGSQAGMYQPLIDMAMTNNADMQARGGVPTAGDLDQFINPYVNFVLGNSLDRLQEQSDINMTKIGSTAGMSGAFGGLRHGVLEGANLAELLKSARDLSANTYSDAYDKGMGNWFRSQDLRRGTIRDALDITGQGSAYNRGDINNLMQTGLVGRTRDQSVLDFAFSEFMREQQDPFTKAGFASSILSSYPTNLFTRNSKSETTSTPSPFSQIAGVGLAAAGLMTGNPAAAAGLMSGQQSLGMGSPIGGIDITGPGGLSSSQMGGMSLDDIMAQIRKTRGGGFAKGGLIKGYKRGGKIRRYDPKSWEVPNKYLSILDQITPETERTNYIPLDEILREKGEAPIETPYFREKASDPRLDFSLEGLGNRFMRNFPLFNEPIFTYSDDDPEQRASKSLAKTDTKIAADRLNRLALQGRLTRTPDVEPIDYLLKSLAKDAANEKRINDDWIKEWAPQAHEDLANKSTRTDPLEDFLIPDGEFQRQYTHTLASGPQGKKKKYAKGGEVETKFFNGGMAALFGGAFGFGDKPKPQTPVAPPANMVEAFNSPQYQTQGGYRQGSLFGFSILDALARRGVYSPDARSRQVGSTPAPYVPKPQTPYDWASFYERQGLNRIPTAQSNINPNYASGNRPDLSMFMQMLQERLGGQSGGGQLPTPPFQTQGFAEGGSVYLKMKPSTQGVQDLNSLLGFIPTDEVYGGGNTLPISDLLDNERVFKLALQKHESGAKEYDKPNYKARPIDEKGNALSSAFGVGQWILPTWNILARKSKGEIPSWTQDKLDKGEFPDQATQEKAWDLWNEMLRNKYGNDYVSRFAAHQVGDAGFNKLRKANSNKLVKDILGVNVARNVGASKETIGEYFNRLNSYVGNARNWEVDRLKAKGGIATDIMRSGNPRIDAYNVASNRTQYPQDVLEALMSRGGVDTQPFQRKGDLIIKPLQASPAGASASAPTDDGNYQIEDYRPSNRDGRVSRTTRSAAPRTFNSPLDIFVKPAPKDDYLESRIEGVPADAMLPDFTIGGRSAISQNDLERMMLESGIDPQPFKKKKQYSGGGYVKKFAKGQIVETDPHAIHSTDEDVLYKFNQGAPSLEDWLSNAWNRIRQPAFGPPPQGNNPQRHISKGNVSPWTNVDMGILTPDVQGTSPEDFNMALENGEPSDIVSQPAQEQLKEDALTTALKAMIMQEIENRKNYKEPSPPTFLGREINMPLLKMGLGILANSDYPNSAGAAIGKGILGALNEEEQAQLDKQKRNNDKLKELLNLRYMQGMVESMDPNIKMQLQRERAAQEITQKALEKQQEYELRMALYEAQRQGKVDDALAIAKGKLQAENEALFGITGEDEGINVD